MEIQKSYYAIIPADVRYNSDLTPNAKLLYGEITALCNEKGYCWATNEYFSELYSKEKETISRWISSLKKEGYIDIKMTYKEDSKEIEKRFITLLTKKSIPIEKIIKGGIDKKVKDNTTVINNTDIYIGKSEKLDEKTFLEMWSRARLHYDKKPTNISKLGFNERSDFEQLVKDYSLKDFEYAIAGMFFQDTLPNVRVRPTHFLKVEYFETYLDCWKNKTKLFTKQSKKKDNTGMI